MRASRLVCLSGLLLSGLLSAGCLQVVSDTEEPGQPAGGTTGLNVNSAGSGTSGGTASGTGAGGSATTGGGACTYPSPSAGGTLFPDLGLGVGWVNTTAAVDSSTAASAQSTALLQLHCSGARYALIGILAAWNGESQQVAQSLPAYTTAWLAESGLVLTVLEQGSSGSAPASQADLTNWANQYGTNYSLVNDPNETALTNLGIVSWPALYIVRLSDMVIVNYSVPGGSANFLMAYASLLAQPGP